MEGPQLNQIIRLNFHSRQTIYKSWKTFPTCCALVHFGFGSSWLL